jgi:multiple sugar transport system permease protein/raffinose/stachyose/melibiose transport system permease protein
MRAVRRNWVYLPLLAYTVFAVFPFFWVAALSLRTVADIYANPYGLPWPPRFDNYLEIWTKFNYAIYFRNSIVVTVVAVVIGTAAGSMAAYVLSRPRFAFRYRDVITMLIFISIMFPPQITLIALFQNLVKLGLYNTLQGLTLVYSAVELPLTIYLLRAFFVQIPGELEDAARLDGCSDWRMFWQIMFPIARPAVVAVTILNFIGHWNEFLYAVVFISKEELRTLPLAVMFFMGENFQDISMLATGMMVAMLPVALIYIFFSETLIDGMTAGAVKG